MKKVLVKIRKFWDWLWNSESWLSYIVFLAIVFVFVKFIFLPVLGLLMGTSLPLAIVESSSMYHKVSAEDSGALRLCDEIYEKREKVDFDKYWNVCGSWYEENNITKIEFSDFKFPNGFSKGDLMIIVGKDSIKLGDVIIFEAGSRHPIIHRVTSLSPLQTKGDHNPAQLASEKNIDESQIIGTAVARVPYVGWIKLFFVELFR